MRTHLGLITLLVVIGLVVPVGAQEVGPSSGSLVIVGGAMRSVEIRQRFMELAGGPDVLIVVVPTAGGEEEYGQDYRGLRIWREVGATHLHVLHTKDRSVADSEEFVQPLTEAGGVWFVGGRQWHIADSYLGTRTGEAFWGVLERGGVIGGTSAGARETSSRSSARATSSSTTTGRRWATGDSSTSSGPATGTTSSPARRSGRRVGCSPAGGP